MKRRLLILTIVLGLIITIMPRTVNAANNKVINQKRIAERQKFKVTKPTKAQLYAVGNDIDEYYKQLVLESIDEIYAGSLKEKYSAEIKQLIQETYDSLSNEINNMENISNHIMVIDFFGFGIPVLDEEMNEKLYTFDTLTQLNTERVSDDTSFDEFKYYITDVMDEAFECFEENRSEFNNYYYTIITGDKTFVSKTLNDANDWTDMVNALGKVRTHLGNYEYFINFSDSLDLEFYCEYGNDDDEDYYYYDDDDNDSDESEILESLGITKVPEIYIGQKIYTNTEINTIRDALKTYLNNYVDKQLVNSGVSNSDIRLLADSTIGQINANQNVDEILAIYETDLEKYIKRTGVEYKEYNPAKATRYTKKIKALEETYLNPNKYYEFGGLETNQKIIDTVLEAIIYDDVLYDVEIPSDIIERLTNLLNETPTYQDELKSYRRVYITDLRSYIKNKKYNQTKVVPIVNEGMAKLNATKDIDRLEYIYYTYITKAEKTVYKFKITTSKTGKGTITKTRTVNYGNSFTVNIIPNAGYKISALYVDGKKVKVRYKYTFKNVTKKHTIKAIFK